MKHKDEKDMDKLNENAKKKIQLIFKRHGLSTYRKIGLQRSLRTIVVEAALTGIISPI